MHKPRKGKIPYGARPYNAPSNRPSDIITYFLLFVNSFIKNIFKILSKNIKVTSQIYNLSQFFLLKKGKLYCIIMLKEPKRRRFRMNYYVKDFGAAGDGVTLDTVAIQKAIDTAGKHGGKVIIEDGVFKTGGIRMHSNVELHIAAGATLLASENIADFPNWKSAHVDSDKLPLWKSTAIIFADECENIAITGMGTIDGNGSHCVEKKTGDFEGWIYKRISDDVPLRGVFLAGCKNVKIENITMVNQPSACWSYWVHDCDRVSFNACKMLANLDYPHCDGIHINSSRDISVSNCTINCGDDCLIIRANNSSLKENKVCERVTVTNCTVTSYSAGIRVGWVRDGVIRNCSFQNIVMTDTTCGIDIYIPKDYETSDRGRESTLVENLSFSNIIMNEVYGKPVKIHVVESEKTYVKAVRNLYFHGIRARALEFPLILGKSDCYVEDLTFSDCRFEEVKEEAFPKNKKHHGPAAWSATSHTAEDMVTNARNVIFNSTVFTRE